MSLITSDEYKPYKKAILKAYGKKTMPPHTGKRGHPKGSRRVPPKGLKYATVHKRRRKGRVVKIVLRVIFDSKAEVEAAIEASAVSKMINTAFVERHNGTDRNRNVRKVRKSYCFSKDWEPFFNICLFFLFASKSACLALASNQVVSEIHPWGINSHWKFDEHSWEPLFGVDPVRKFTERKKIGKKGEISPKGVLRTNGVEVSKGG